jgi:hypothetical protein
LVKFLICDALDANLYNLFVCFRLSSPQFIADYRTPAQKMISRDLLARLNKQIDFLAECRPLAVAMGNAIKHLKLRVQQLDPTLPEERAKAILTDTIDNFVMVLPRLSQLSVPPLYPNRPCFATTCVPPEPNPCAFTYSPIHFTENSFRNDIVAV